MDAHAISELRDRLQRERRDLVEVAGGNREALQSITEIPRRERQELAQRERDADVLEQIKERAERRLAEVDAAIARLDAGTYGACEECGRKISTARLRADPAASLCAVCAENQAPAESPLAEDETTFPPSGELPPDLEILDDDERTEYLNQLVRDDGRIDAQELQISTRQGVVYLEGALPSEPEHQMLLNLLTDVAGIRDIVDHLEIQRLAWERSDRSKAEDAREIPAGDLHDNEPYGGTEDVVLSQEEGVNYDPPENPPPPPHRKD